MGGKMLSHGANQKGRDMIYTGCRLFAKSIGYTLNRSIGLPKTTPNMVNISVTYKCDSRCTVCNVWKRYLKNPKKVEEEMTFDEFKKFVDLNPHLEDVILGGGEVFLRDDIVDMWLFLDQKGFRTGTTTNAIDVDGIIEKEERLLKEISGRNSHSIQISIDGLGRTHDRIRGVIGNFKKSEELLKWAIGKQSKLRFFSTSISHNITQENYAELPQFLDYFIDFGLKPNQISFRIPTTSNLLYDNLNTFESVGDIQKLVDIIRIAQKGHPTYKNDFYIEKMIDQALNPNKPVIPCFALTSFLYVDPYWMVYPCINWNEQLGNLRENGFRIAETLKTGRVDKLKRWVKENQCPICWNKCHGMRSAISNPYYLFQAGLSSLLKR